MSSKVKVFGLIALLGFIAGIVAQVFATFVIPWIQENWPDLGQFCTLPGHRSCWRGSNSSACQRLGIHDR